MFELWYAITRHLIKNKIKNTINHTMKNLTKNMIASMKQVWMTPSSTNTELWSTIDSNGKLLPFCKFRMVPYGPRKAQIALPINVLPQFAGPKKND